MGTSSPTSGTISSSPLIPTWLDEPVPAPLPCGDEIDGGQLPQTDGGETKSPIILAPESARFRGARANFSRFAASGGNDHDALKRAVGSYVRSGVGGSKNAVIRMGASRIAASNALGVFRGIQRDGVQKTLHSLGLNQLVGQGVQDIFLGLTEVICKDGGTVDEAMARSAWLETIAELEQLGITDNLESLSSAHIKELFLRFIAHTIEIRLYQEIGVNGFKCTDNIGDIESFDKQLREYIEGAVQDSFTGGLDKISGMKDTDIWNIVNRTYDEVWSLLETLGDTEE